jgi:galactokinase
MALHQPSHARLEKLTAALDSTWGPTADPGATQVVRAPGVVTLIGDHTESSEGFVLAGAIELDTWIAFRPRRDGLVRAASTGHDDTGSFWIDALEPAPAGGMAGGMAGGTAGGPDGRMAGGPAGAWSDYVGGAAWSLREAALPVRGFEGVADTTIPAGVELGSRAALEVASVLALLGGRHVLSGPALASIAQRAERDYVGADSGIVDQMASAAGRDGKAMLLDTRNLDMRHVPLPYGVRLVICDTGAADPRKSELLARRADCARALALLAERMPGLCSLRDLDAAALRRHRHLLPEISARRAEHVISENARVVATSLAMEAGDLDSLGRLFAESHASLRDLYDVGSPALDTMVEVARAVPGVIASRMTGPGFGGCTVNFVLADAVPALEAAVTREYDGRTGLTSRVYPVALVNGAGPLAGL